MRRTVAGIDDGNPNVLDALPAATITDLPNNYAADPTGAVSQRYAGHQRNHRRGAPMPT